MRRAVSLGEWEAGQTHESLLPYLKEEAIEFANSSPYGLSGSVWTQDAELGRSVAGRLDVGMAYINEHGTTMAELPFGGVKRSGYGRELASYGMDEFANKKLIRTSGR